MDPEFVGDQCFIAVFHWKSDYYYCYESLLEAQALNGAKDSFELTQTAHQPAAGQSTLSAFLKPSANPKPALAPCSDLNERVSAHDQGLQVIPPVAFLLGSVLLCLHCE